MSISSKAKRDTRLLAFWVLVWMPAVTTGYIALSSACAPTAPLKAWAGWVAFIYVLFAPALCHLFLARPASATVTSTCDKDA